MSTIAEAIVDGRTPYLKNVHAVNPGDSRLLKPAKDNGKLGKNGRSKVWRAGAFRGMPLYSLTLEERATCDTACQAWKVCYGNNMPFAHRFQAGDDLTRGLEIELGQLDRKHPEGYSVRLHILGDFYSVAYVEFWAHQLRIRPALHVYGYTHRLGEIRDAIHATWLIHQKRFNILQSDGDGTDGRPIALLETSPGAEALPICPEQICKNKHPMAARLDACEVCNAPRAAAGCLDCGLCTNPNIKGVRFLIH